jgi:hypothetical protein
MGSATVQRQLWGTLARDWAAYGEQICLPLQGAALDAAHVTAGTRRLRRGPPRSAGPPPGRPGDRARRRADLACWRSCGSVCRRPPFEKVI